MQTQSTPTALSQAIKPIMDEVVATIQQFPSQFGLSPNVYVDCTIAFDQTPNGTFLARLSSFSAELVKAKTIDYAVEQIKTGRADKSSNSRTQEERLSTPKALSLTHAELLLRISKTPREIVPSELPRLICFINPNAKVLRWAVCAFGNGFTGHLVALGETRYIPIGGLKDRVMLALEQLTEWLLSKKFIDQAGTEHTIERCLIDANWGMITQELYRFSRLSKFADIITPSHGKYLGPKDKTIEQWTRQDGDRVGHHWRERFIREFAKRFVLFDTNRWNSLVYDRIRTAIGDLGAFTIYDAHETHHQMLFEHVTNVTPVEKVQDSNRLTVYTAASGSDSSLFECIVGCHVGASMQGVQLS